jgi:hypothetical protein
MRTAIFGLIAVAAGCLLAPGDAGAAEPTAQEIMERNFFATKNSSLKIDLTMVLVNDRGQKRERKSTTLIKLQPNGIDSKFLVTFSTPADIKGTGFLQVEHSEGDDDLWIYLPALKKSRRLVANNKKDSFVGSDFSYGDIALPRVTLYNHKLLRSETVDDLPCYVIESSPVDDSVRSNSGYSRKTTWVRQDNFVEVKVEYFDLAGRLLKTQRTGQHELVEPAKGRWFARRREMTNHQNGHKTVITAESLDATVPVPDEQFTTRNIERA